MAIVDKTIIADSAGDVLLISAAGAAKVEGTVDLGATDNAVLDAIAASVAAIDTDATTMIGHLDGVEGLLGTIDADTGNIVTSVQLLDDTVAVLGTDTFTEASTKGITIGAVRRDADTSLVDTTNEIGPLQMNALGQLKVEAFSGETLPVSLSLDATKTQGISIMSLQTIAASTGIRSDVISFDRKLKAKFYIYFGREAATAAGAGVNIRIESSSESSGDGNWIPESIFTTQFAAVSDEAVSGTEAAGQTVISVASTTGLTAQDIVFFFNSTIGNSEWGRITSISTNTSITLEDALTNAQTGSTIYDGAEMFVSEINVEAGVRYSAYVDGSLFTQPFAIRVRATTFDSAD